MPTSLKIFEFAYFPKYDESVEFLATRLADPENWNFTDSNLRNFPILKNYLEHTFRKLKSESKICYSANNSFACFNTGLVTNHYEEIYAFFEKNRMVTGRSNLTPFFFKAFVKKSDTRILNNFADNFPRRANYFDKPEELIFNPRCEIITDIDHIIQDNINRLPVHLQTAPQPQLRREFNGAIDEVNKKVITN